MSNDWNTTGLRRRGVSVLKVLGVVFIVLILICGGVITYVVRNARTLMVRGMGGPMIAMIQETHLPEDQKSRLSDIFNKVMDDFEAEAISWEQSGEITQKLFDGPFFNLMMVEVLEAKHLDTVKLEEKERAEVSLTFDRFERGIQEGTIPEDAWIAVLEKVSEESDDGDQTLEDDLTAEDLTVVVSEMKSAADEAGIPMENYQVDFVNELQKVVDEVLGNAPATAPA